MRNFRILGQVSTKSTGPMRSLRVSAARGIFCLLSLLAVTPLQAQISLPTRSPDFDSRSLMGSGTGSNGDSRTDSYGGSRRGPVSGFALVNPGRFSMQQSYSVTASSSRAGTASSGLYLNTLGYKISDPLFLYADVGMYTPIHSTVAGMRDNAGAMGTSLVLPRFGLEYKPSDRWTLNFEWVNGQDAWKAYGPGPSSFYGSRTP